MDDLKAVLERALDHVPTPEQDANPQDDLRRGRGLLLRRRALRAGAVLGAAAVAIAVIPLMAKSPAPGAHPAGRADANADGTVRLVAYNGAQPPGYEVKEIPAGWVIQGSNSFALVIAPANDPDKNPDSFLGKIMVGWQSTLGSSAFGKPVKVNGRPGYYQADAGAHTQMLVFEDAHGRWLDVQSPAGLRWSLDQLLRFGGGVTVLPGAKKSKG